LMGHKKLINSNVKGPVEHYATGQGQQNEKSR